LLAKIIIQHTKTKIVSLQWEIEGIVAGEYAVVAGEYAVVAGEYAVVAGEYAVVAGEW